MAEINKDKTPEVETQDGTSKAMEVGEDVVGGKMSTENEAELILDSYSKNFKHFVAGKI